MTVAVPEVQWVLDAIADHWTGSESDIANVPLERIDRDNAYNIDLDKHVNKEDPPRTNLVGASSETLDSSPIGTEYDLEIQAVVNVRLQGATARKHGEVDRTETNANHRWQYLKENVRRTIMSQRINPQVADRANRNYLHVEWNNVQDLSRDFGDFYRWEGDVLFFGFDTLP